MTTHAALLQADAEARIRALAEASFIVEAPAGAGKTELLTQRCLKLLARAEQPEEVVAITFTNKAAAEMRDRILSRLAAARDHAEPPPAPHLAVSWRLARATLTRDAELGWGLLDHPGRLRVTTIDALCANLARQMPYLSRFGATPAVVTNADEHYQEAARRTLALIEGDDAAAQTVLAALAWLDNDAPALERLLTDMLARRDQWLHHAHRIEGEDARIAAEAGLRRLIEADLKRALHYLTPGAQTLLRPAARFAASRWEVVAALADWQDDLAGTVDELPIWRALVSLLTDSKPGFRAQLNARQGFPAGDGQGKALAGTLLGVLDELRGQGGALDSILALTRLPNPDLGGDWPQIECYARLLRLAAAQLWLVFQQAGEVDFAEIAFQARQALGDDEAPTDLALALDYRIRHLLVDEFQDTSPAQVDLLARLTRGWQAGDGRTLFLVGDPMQSIYRFRKAEVGLFLKVQAEGIGDVRLEPLALFRNNRSHPEVVDWINTHFPQVFAPESDLFAGAVAYRPFVAGKAPETSAGVSFHAIVDTGDAESARRREAQQVLAIIDATRAARPAAKIAVLVRGREHLAPLVAEIRRQRAQFRYLAVEIESLAGRQPIQDLISLTRALLHRGDRVHWLAVLRAPWCGLTLADLLALAGGNTAASIWQCMQPDQPGVEAMSENGQRRLAHLRDIVAEALAEQGRMPVRRWVESVWRMLDGPACLNAPGELDDCLAYFALLEQLENAGRLELETLEAEVTRLYASPDPGADDRLQFMTLHKSKGLEFDTVIVPGLDRQPGGGSNPLLVWGELADDHGDTLLAAPRRRGGEGEATPYAYLCQWEASRRAHEDERLLYVAATRAERCLHWLAVAGVGIDGSVAKPAKSSLLRLLWPGMAETAFASAPLEQGEHADSADTSGFIPDLVRLAKPELPQVYREPAGMAIPDQALRERIASADESTSRVALLSLDASVGTLVHRHLEMAAKNGSGVWRGDQYLPRWRRWLRQQGHAAGEAEKGAARVSAILERCLHSATGRWMLADRPAAAAELALTSCEGAALAQHVIDRTFIEDGVRWIVDYKTSHVTGNSDADYAARAEIYRPQLERYAALFAGEGLPRKLAIYFAEADRLIELPVP